MDTKLLDYYNRELAWLREMGAEFAERYPKVAGRLGMRGIDVADPYTERLMEGFAFLTSRVQLKMDAEFPRFSQHLLEMIAPNYLAPMPSMAIAELHPDMSKGDVGNGFCVARGTRLENVALKQKGVYCAFTTAQDVVLHPLSIQHVELGGVPVDAPLSRMGIDTREAASALRIRLACDEKVQLQHLRADDLMFCLCGPDIEASGLLELLLAHGIGQYCQTREEEPQQLLLADDALRQEGFAPEQALLPDEMRNFSGYRLMQEYFAFPQRFQFISLHGLKPLQRISPQAREFDIIILLDKREVALERVVDASHLALNCTPVINLFPQQARRERFNESRNEYHLVVDALKPLDFEIFSVDRLVASGHNVEREFRPFWSSYSRDEGNYGAYFAVRRESRRLSEQAHRYGTRTGYVGSEVFVSLVDEAQSPWADGLETFSAEVMCTNRDLPLLLAQPDRASFALPSSMPVANTTLRKGPTMPRPSLAEGYSTWRLISHLQMNYLSLLEQEEGKASGVLRQMLGLYANLAEAQIARQIEGIRRCTLRPVNRRVPEPGPIVFARGISIELQVDEQAFSGISPWVLGSVLDQVFSRLVSINSFTELSMTSQQRGQVGIWRRRSGKRSLL
ncbi:type VI secretion system baseplate subunit TssF [Pantoea sp. A4]|uniref:type VI secretion system baseplate subunit TssF n=1 Tax=Pantoea sp. A4 TaxID=1225184 RepID=UPI00037C52A3|nr:type VI secretion system baseplate subunit TssF [Pantoea sp. A4]